MTDEQAEQLSREELTRYLANRIAAVEESPTDEERELAAWLAKVMAELPPARRNAIIRRVIKTAR